MKHLEPDELVDLVEGTLALERRVHADECPTCREEAARLTVMLREAREVEIPEPSPLFWDRFSSRVRAAIAEEETPQAGWAPAWLRWNVLVPLGALALLLFALTAAIPRQPAGAPLVGSVAQPASIADDPAAAGEPTWTLLSAIVGPMDVEHAHEAGIVVRPGDLERAALELSGAEQQELLRLLTEQTEIGTLQ